MWWQESKAIMKKLNQVSLLGLTIIFCICSLLAACSFHLQGRKQLAPELHRLYLQAPDPYGQLARSLTQYLKMSNVQLVSCREEAITTLAILRDDTSQELLSVSGTQQTRQYNLRVTVVFDVLDRNGLSIIGPQMLTETRTITIQSNQVLGSSNEANLFYQQMRRTLAYSILNRLASREVTHGIIMSSHPRP